MHCGSLFLMLPLLLMVWYLFSSLLCGFPGSFKFYMSLPPINTFPSCLARSLSSFQHSFPFCSSNSLLPTSHLLVLCWHLLLGTSECGEFFKLWLRPASHSARLLVPRALHAISELMTPHCMYVSNTDIFWPPGPTSDCFLDTFGCLVLKENSWFTSGSHLPEPAFPHPILIPSSSPFAKSQKLGYHPGFLFHCLPLLQYFCCCSVAKSCLTATALTVACQASLSFTTSWSLSPWCYLTISSSAIPSPLAHSLSQHQGLFQWDDSWHQVAKVLEL